MYNINLIRRQVNAAGHNEKTVRVEVPEADDSGWPRSVLVNVILEPAAAAAATTTVKSTSDDGHYTYYSWMSKSMGAATDRTDGEPYDADRETEDYSHDEDDDNVDLRILPVSTLSKAADCSFCPGRRVTVTSVIVYLVSQLVVAAVLSQPLTQQLLL